MRQGDLVTRDRVRDWLNQNQGGAQIQTNQASERLLDVLITACSRWVQTYLNRRIPPADYSLTVNGRDTQAVFLPERPVISVSSVKVNGVAVAASVDPPLGAGFLFDDTRVYLVGSSFTRGPQNVTIGYSAGFQAKDSGVTVPANGEKLHVDGLLLPWNADRSVAYSSSGAALTRVASGPAQGQYALVADAAKALFAYQFSAADGGQLVDVTYGYTPEDLAQAVVELVGEAFKRRNRIGEASINIGNGQTVSFLDKDTNESVRTVLNQWKNVVPV